MTVVELLLRVTAALVLGDPSVGAVPLLAAAALGIGAVAVAVLVAAVLALVLGLLPARSTAPTGAPADLVTRIAWSHPDADGHARPRAPGAVAPA
ncbi:hypothetical protein GCM10017714_08770 [Curtobacterium pusillum]|uniref:Uncharacterized protein n=1 Tax=Curtobacterium pusillum TaxID=69373 RepID=A0AAW3T7Y4_9MICO|nr:DUF6412 domain-containing protein [Curtobacterium pusillum]MBA8990303.1 hypothetical protein [Curtobacterium pusillum]NUU13031.1 hypothetical protein [Curtobacterium pusillum]GLK30140.1 hypothetical protein GCM10017610_04250 [Curtobacterium pusillum]